MPLFVWVACAIWCGFAARKTDCKVLPWLGVILGTAFVLMTLWALAYQGFFTGRPWAELTNVSDHMPVWSAILFLVMFLDVGDFGLPTGAFTGDIVFIGYVAVLRLLMIKRRPFRKPLAIGGLGT